MFAGTVAAQLSSDATTRLQVHELADLPGAVAEQARHSTLPVQAAFLGSLYNRKELLGQLPAMSDVRDVSLLLAAYSAWGAGLLDKLVGDFSLAVWDEGKRRLLAAVDPFGTRNFYYLRQAGRLDFATHPRLLADLRPSRPMIVRFLTNRWGAADETFYEELRQLPGGHRLLFENGQLHVERYWQPGGSRSTLPPAEALSQFEALCRRSVADRLPAHEPAALVMSGGIDSTSIAGLIADLKRERERPPVTVVAGVFPGLPCDETPFIDAVLAQTGLPARRVPDLTAKTSVELLRAEVRCHAAPLLNPQGPLFAAFMAEAHAAGARVVLNGLGGDELTIDFGYLKDLFNHLRWRRLASGVRGVLERYPFVPSCLHLARELCPEPLKLPYRWLKKLLPRAPISAPDWLTPEARREAMASAPTRGVSPGFVCHTLDEAWQILTAPATQAGFAHWHNEFAAAGLQSASPFLDRRLFEFVFSLPFGSRPTCDADAPFKPLFTRGLARHLPESIRKRDDKVSLDAYSSLVFSLGLPELREHLFAGSNWRAEEYVTRERARSLFEFHFDADENRRDPLAVSAKLQPLRLIAALELWLREIESNA